MTNKQLAEALGFNGGGSVNNMLESLGFSSKKLSDIKKENKQLKLKSLLIEKYEITLSELIEMIEEKRGNLK